MEAIVLIFSLFVAYFLACNHLDRQEARLGTNKHSYLWVVWFGYATMLQSIAIFSFGIYHRITKEVNEEFILSTDMFSITIGILLFGLSFAVLKKNKVAWFVASLLTLNPVYWLINTVYFFKNRQSFQKI